MSTWVKAANLSDIADGEVIGHEIDGENVAVYNIDGKIYATDNICTHAFALLSNGYLDDCTIECPLHAGRFDVRTGKALSGPVTNDLKVYKTKVENGDILIDLD
jgi:nitrite reductase/ring-hydroxylating ferredoxin subunit